MAKTIINPRLISLDIFRGMVIVLMIIVNSPGNNVSYAWLSHAAWNGCTLADLIFPSFLFITGISLVYSLSPQLARGQRTTVLLLKVFKRAALLLLLGLFLNAFPYHFDSSLRIFGVLQRIAICYLFVSILYLQTSIRTQVIVAITLLLGYWVLMTCIPVPGIGSDHLTPNGNLAAYIDRLIFPAQNLYGKIFDPEGLLSTLPALVTTLLGTFTARWLRAPITNETKLFGMLVVGLLGMTMGWCWGLYFPINKNLWTSSYVLWTAGIALVSMGLLYWLIEIKHLSRCFKIFEIFGVNAIVAYFLHIFFLKIQAMIKIQDMHGHIMNLRIYLSETLFSHVNLYNASLFYALSYATLLFIFLATLYRKHIFIKL